jgi:hypothetical protein
VRVLPENQDVFTGCSAVNVYRVSEQMSGYAVREDRSRPAYACPASADCVYALDAATHSARRKLLSFAQFWAHQRMHQHQPNEKEIEQSVKGVEARPAWSRSADEERCAPWEQRLDRAFHWNNHGRADLDRNAYLYGLVMGDALYREKAWLSVRGTEWARTAGNDEVRGVYRNIRCDWAPCGVMLRDLAELAAHCLTHLDTKYHVPQSVRIQFGPGQAVDILDGEMIWYPARIIDASPGRFLIRYDDEQWSQEEFDEWVWRDSPRIAPRGYYTASKRSLPQGTYLPQNNANPPRDEGKTAAIDAVSQGRYRVRHYTGRANRKRALNASFYRR